MKYCLIVPSLEERHGGPSKSVLGLAKALAEGGDQTELLATDPLSSWDRVEGKLSINVYKRSWPKSIASSSGLQAHLRSGSSEVVHHHSIWLRTLHYAHAAAKHRDASFVISPRGMMNRWAWHHHPRRKALARALIHPRAFEEADGWHATSHEEAGAISSLGFKQPVCIAPNGVDIPTPEEIESAAEHWRGILGSAGEHKIALFYSRFHQKKRLIELIDCWLEQAPKDWLLVVAGIPETHTPHALEEYVLRSGGAGRVKAYDGTGKPPPYGIASLFVLPSHSENFGLSIAEALAHGVPTLVTDTTPWSDLNRNGAGWCVPWRDFGKALREATSEDADTLKKRGQVGREWVSIDYSWKKSAALLSQFYAGLRP